MRSKNREINIFNMSLLDILTGALGAFMFMMLSFVPYYNIVVQNKLESREDKSEELEKLKLEKEDLKKKLEELEKRVADLEKTNEELQKKNEELIEQLKKAGKGDVTLEELAALQEENDRLRKEIASLKQDISELEAKIDQLVAQLMAANLKLEKLEAEAAKLRKDNDVMKHRVAEVEAKLVAVSNERDQLKARVLELEEQLKKMRPNGPNLEEQLKIQQLIIEGANREITLIEEGSPQSVGEFYLRDPRGTWYSGNSTYPLGQKSVRARIFTRPGMFETLLIKNKLRGNDQNARRYTPGDISRVTQFSGFYRAGRYLLAYRPKPGWTPSANPQQPNLLSAFAIYNQDSKRGSSHSLANVAIPDDGMLLLAVIRVGEGVLDIDWGDAAPDSANPNEGSAAREQFKKLNDSIRSEKIDPVSTSSCNGPTCNPYQDPRGDMIGPDAAGPNDDDKPAPEDALIRNATQMKEDFETRLRGLPLDSPMRPTLMNQIRDFNRQIQEFKDMKAARGIAEKKNK